VKKLEIKIKKMPDYDAADICLLPQKIFKDLKLSSEIIYNVYFGQLSKNCFFKPNKTQKHHLYVPEPIYNHLTLCDKRSLNIWRKDNDIFLGPVVGIFEPPWILSRIENGGAYYYEMQYMKASIAENCLCYYFSIEDIDWLQGKIRGLTFNPELDEWRYCIFPIPNVIYDEGIFLREDVKLVAKYIRKQFRAEPRIHLINSRNSFGKWELCKELRNIRRLKNIFQKQLNTQTLMT
jgi:hypothetical protein